MPGYFVFMTRATEVESSIPVLKCGRGRYHVLRKYFVYLFGVPYYKKLTSHKVNAVRPLSALIL